MKIAPDDPVYQSHRVWLGPDSGGTAVTLPFTARYLAYVVWLAIFGVVLLVEGLTPLRMGIPPVWEICGSTLATMILLAFIDHERPLVSVWQTFRADLGAPRTQKPRPVLVRERFSVVRVTRIGRLYLWRKR